MTAINEVTDLTLHGNVAVLTLNSPPVNALSFNVRDGLFEGITAALAEPVDAIVLISVSPWARLRSPLLLVRIRCCHFRSR